MKVLLIGTDRTLREERKRLLAEAGFQAFATSAEDADVHMAEPDIGCLVLGSSLSEQMAEFLASEFTATVENRMVVRMVEVPVTTNYPYAHIVVSPRNPAALLAAVKAVEIRLKQKIC